MKKSKILFILHFPPPVHGAAMVGQFIRNSNILRSNFDCVFINLGLSREVSDIGKTNLKKIKNYFRLLIKVLINLKKFKPDLCYITPTSAGTGLYKDIPVIVIAKFFKVKIVYHFHNKGVSKRQNRTLDNWLYKWMFNESKVILLSKHLYVDIKKYVSPDQVYYCANGIADETLNYSLKLNKSKKLLNVELLFLSNLIKTKGVQVLLEACKDLKDNGLPFHCNFVGGIGDISLAQFNSSVRSLNLSDEVDYIGKKHGMEKSTAFKNADIFVHPTLNDCVPLVILEAMQYSLPVISTYEGGIPDLVENRNTGFLVRKNNVKDLSVRLQELINSKKSRELMGKAGRRKYEQQFTIALFEKRFLDIINQILK